MPVVDNVHFYALCTSQAAEKRESLRSHTITLHCYLSFFLQGTKASGNGSLAGVRPPALCTGGPGTSSLYDGAELQ